MGAATQLNELTLEQFVKENVKQTELTAKILNYVYRYYPKGSQCISGYLDVNDQYWKINFHWENLVYHLDLFISMAIPENLKGGARAVRKVMMDNPPNPQNGYRTDKKVGDTKDVSSMETIQARHKVLSQCKKDFRYLLLKARVIDVATEFSGTPDKDKHWWLSIAKVAFPGTSLHGSGYALDIKGDNKVITEISKSLGATLVFNESSHVHVEFGNLSKL